MNRTPAGNTTSFNFGGVQTRTAKSRARANLQLAPITRLKHVRNKILKSNMTPDAVVFRSGQDFWSFLLILLTRTFKPTVFIFGHKIDGGKFLPKRAVRYSSVPQTFVPEREDFFINSHDFFSGVVSVRYFRNLRSTHLASKLRADFGPFAEVIFAEDLKRNWYFRLRRSRKTFRKSVRRFFALRPRVNQLVRSYFRLHDDFSLALRGRLNEGVGRYLRLFNVFFPTSRRLMKPLEFLTRLRRNSHASLRLRGNTQALRRLEKIEYSARPSDLLVFCTSRQVHLLSILSLIGHLKRGSVSVLPQSHAAWLRARKFFLEHGVAVTLLEPIHQGGTVSDWDANRIEKEVGQNLDSVDPKLAISFYDLHPVGRAISKVCQRRKIRFLFVQTLYHSEAPQYGRYTIPQAENISVIDDYSESLFTDFFQFDGRRVNNFGCPAYDLASRSQRHIEQKSGIRILFGLQPVPPQSTKEVISVVEQFQDERKLLRRQGVQVVIRPHPSSLKPLVKAISKAVRRVGGEVISVDRDLKKVDWTQFDVFVGFASNLHTDALLNGVPSVSIKREAPYAVPLVEMGVSIGADLDNRDVVAKALSLATNSSLWRSWREKADAYLARNPALNNGDSAKRILSWAGLLPPRGAESA